MDGVLADFATAAGDFFGIDFNKGFVKVENVEWARLKEEWPTFWLDLDVLPYAMDLWRGIHPWNPSLLTATPDGWRSAGTGKELWAKRHLPKFGYHPQQKVHAVLRSEKKNFAKSDGQPNVLIDDLEKNISEWERAGGIGVLYTPSRSAIQTVVDTLQSVV